MFVFFVSLSFQSHQETGTMFVSDLGCRVLDLPGKTKVFRFCDYLHMPTSATHSTTVMSILKGFDSRDSSRKTI
jgi:hypothetical protein